MMVVSDNDDSRLMDETPGPCPLQPAEEESGGASTVNNDTNDKDGA